MVCQGAKGKDLRLRNSVPLSTGVMVHVSELRSARATMHSASYVQDDVDVWRVLLQQLDGLFRRHDEQFNFATIGFILHLFHHWQGTVAGADHQATALLRYPFLQRQRCVSEGFSAH